MGAACLMSLVLAGCGDGPTAASDPSAETTTDSTGASAAAPTTGTTERSLPGPDYVVPEVVDPLDVTTLGEDPCALLTADQLTRLGVGVGQATGDGSCTWATGSAGAQGVDVLVAGIRSTSLSAFYTQYVETGDGSWEPTTVGGRPGALVNGTFEQSTGSCVLLVALAEDAYLRVERGTSPSQDEACSSATEAAGLVLATAGSER